MRRYYFLIAAAVVALDQASKAAVARALAPDGTVTVIPGVFNIIFTRNPGVAFGIFAESSAAWKTAALIVFAALVICLIAAALVAERGAGFTAQGLALGLILGGAIGNLIDRVFSGSVVDFLDFYYGPHHWHTFNLADSAIVVGALLWAATLWAWPKSGHRVIG